MLNYQSKLIYQSKKNGKLINKLKYLMKLNRF